MTRRAFAAIAAVLTRGRAIAAGERKPMGRASEAAPPSMGIRAGPTVHHTQRYDEVFRTLKLYARATHGGRQYGFCCWLTYRSLFESPGLVASKRRELQRAVWNAIQHDADAGRVPPFYGYIV